MKLNAPEFHLSFDYQSSFVSLACRHVSPCIAMYRHIRFLYKVQDDMEMPRYSIY